MREEWRINWIKPEVHGERLHSDLVQIYPEGKQRHSWNMGLYAGDPRIKQIIDRIEADGFKVIDQWHLRGKYPWPTGYVCLRINREYTHADFAASEYLRLYSHAERETNVYAAMDHDLPVVLAATELKKKTHIGTDHTTGHRLFAPAKTRRILESEGLIGLRFDEVWLVDRDVEHDYKFLDWPSDDARWWVLRGERTLPPVSPTVELRSRGYDPYDPNSDGGCRIHEGFHEHPELHYRRADLEAFGEFDIAETLEYFGPYAKDPIMHWKIVSQRFYQVCRKHNLRAKWQPIRLDD